MIAAAAILTAAIFLGANLVLFLGGSFGGARPYRVEVSRIAKEIERHGHGALSLSGYRYVTNVEKIGERVPDGCQNAVGGTGEAGFGTGKKDEKVSSGVAPGNPVLVDPRGIEADSDYLIREIGGVVYRFDYTADAGEGRKSTVLIVNILLGAMALFFISVFRSCSRSISLWMSRASFPAGRSPSLYRRVKTDISGSLSGGWICCARIWRGKKKRR